MDDSVSRRDFLKKTSQVAAAGVVSMSGPAVVRALGATDSINVGCVGLGIRGEFLLKNVLQIPKANVVGICDAYDGYLARAQGHIEKAGRPKAEVFNDYRALLDSKKIDAVVIATPEHWHHKMGLDAIAAGKDMYLEKALAHTIKDGEDLVKAAEANPKRIIQMGTQNRSNPIYAKAKELYESGAIGKVVDIRAFWYRNSLDPAWRYTIPADASPSNCRWEQFLGPAPKRAWDPARMFQWRLYWDYSQGIATDLMTHQLDAIHMVMGQTAPKTVLAQAGTYFWRDGREVPDNWHSIFEYGTPENGFIVQYSSMFSNSKYQYGEQFLGSEGTLEVMERKYITYTPEKAYEKKYPERKAQTWTAAELNPKDSVLLHMENFFECVEARNPNTRCTVRVGEQAATPCHLAIEAYKAHRMVKWDAGSRKWSLA